MKKIGIALLLVLVGLVGVSLWLYSSTDAKHLDQRETVVDVPDTFEK